MFSTLDPVPSVLACHDDATVQQRKMGQSSVSPSLGQTGTASGRVSGLLRIALALGLALALRLSRTIA
jgi:hypothetical protein